jgi:hypothetical protein
MLVNFIPTFTWGYVKYDSKAKVYPEQTQLDYDRGSSVTLTIPLLCTCDLYCLLISMV